MTSPGAAAVVVVVVVVVRAGQLIAGARRTAKGGVDMPLQPLGFEKGPASRLLELAETQSPG